MFKVLVFIGNQFWVCKRPYDSVENAELDTHMSKWIPVESAAEPAIVTWINTRTIERFEVRKAD